MEQRVSIINLDRDTTKILKGIAILFVIFGHMRYYLWAGSGGVAIFLLLSGYGVNLSNERNGLRYYWCKKIKNVWLPYFLIAFITILFFDVRSNNVILCTLLGLDLGMLEDKTMWYISFIMFWYLVFYFAAIITNKNKKRLTRELVKVLVLFIASYAACMLYEMNFWHSNSSASTYVCFFPLGVVLSYLNDVKITERLRRLIWASILFISTAYLLRVYRAFFLYGNAFTVWSTLAMAAQPFAFLQLCEFGGRAKKFLLKMGEYAYPCYLFEGLFLGVRSEWFGIMTVKPFIDGVCFIVIFAFAVMFWKTYVIVEEALPFEKIKF